MRYVTFNDVTQNYQYIVRSFHTEQEAEEFVAQLVARNSKEYKEAMYVNIQIRKIL